MATNPSKNTEQSGNTPENSDDIDFHAVAAALENRDAASLDRLMAVDNGDEDEQNSNDNTSDADENQSQDTDPNEGDSSQEGDNDETNQDAAGATPAAPAEPTEEDIRRELHRLKSEVGRVPALQRQLMQLQSELRAERARGSIGTANPNQSTESKTTPKAAELPEDVRRRLEALREVDPEVAETMELMFRASSQGNADPASLREEILQEVNAQREEEDALRFQQEQVAILAEYVPNYGEVFSSPDWAAWKDTLSPGKRALAESAYAEDVLMAINGFAHYMQAQMNPQGTHQNQSAASAGGGDPNASTQAATSGTSNVAEARSRKVDASPAVRSTTAKGQAPFDEHAAFRDAYSQRMKELGLEK